MTHDSVPDEEEVIGYMTTLSNWSRWGAQDELGTLNLVTSGKRAQAASLVREGHAVPCGWDLDPSDLGARRPIERFMLSTGEGASDRARVVPPGWEGSRAGATADHLGLRCHGHAVTHLDALCHIYWDATMYNGWPSATVTAAQGATHNAVTAARDGIFTRGVLLDISSLSGRPWLEPGEAILVDDLERAEDRAGVRAESGDVLLVRTGQDRKRGELGLASVDHGARPGLHASCLPWLRTRGVAVLGGDAAQGQVPSGYPSLYDPIHVVGIVALGLWLLDNCDLRALAAACDTRRRWEFAFVLAPLPVTGATGSAVQPIAFL